MSDDPLDELRALAEKNGLKVIERRNGHVQLSGGALLVNWYPFSKRRNAYVAGTTTGVPYCSAAQAVALALNPPPIAPKADRDRRRRSYAKVKERLWRIEAKRLCHWCRHKMSYGEATIEHKIPLARGGLDNDNNRVLAHAKCNHSRGCDMPEISGGRVGIENDNG